MLPFVVVCFFLFVVVSQKNIHIVTKNIKKLVVTRQQQYIKYKIPKKKFH